MDTIKRGDHNSVYKGNEDQGGSVRDLSVVKFEQGHVAGDWTFSDEDRQLIAAGATIRLHYFNEPIPPVAMELKPPECDIHEGVEKDYLGEGLGFCCPNCGATPTSNNGAGT